jgi:hypothetical protein
MVVFRGHRRFVCTLLVLAPPHGCFGGLRTHGCLYSAPVVSTAAYVGVVAEVAKQREYLTASWSPFALATNELAKGGGKQAEWAVSLE